MWKVLAKIEMLIKYILAVLILFFSACSMKNYERTQSKIIIIKSPKIKFADLGYVRSTGTHVELELFMAGKSIKKIEINKLICIDEGCMTRGTFNEDYLNESYPSNLFQHILLGMPIYDIKNLEKNENGFIQKIKNEDVDIKYRVNNKQIFFKDRKNNIIIKIKELNEQ